MNNTKTCPHCKSEINAGATKCPHCQSDLRSFVSKHKLSTFLLALTGLVLLVIIASTSRTNSTPATPVATHTATQNQQAVFNVPSLIGKDIKQIRQELGQPTDGAQTDPTAIQLKTGIAEWTNTFNKNGKQLLVTYNPKTNRVIDFFISASDAGSSTNIQAMMNLGGVSTGDPKYRIEPVKSLKNQSEYTGIKIVPQ